MTHICGVVERCWLFYVIAEQIWVRQGCISLILSDVLAALRRSVTYTHKKQKRPCPHGKLYLHACNEAIPGQYIKYASFVVICHLSLVCGLHFLRVLWVLWQRDEQRNVIAENEKWSKLENEKRSIVEAGSRFSAIWRNALTWNCRESARGLGVDGRVGAWFLRSVLRSVLCSVLHSVLRSVLRSVLWGLCLLSDWLSAWLSALLLRSRRSWRGRRSSFVSDFWNG